MSDIHGNRYELAPSEMGAPANARRWAPGQRLSSAAEICSALSVGECIAFAGTPGYVRLNDAGALVNEGGAAVSFIVINGEATIYTPPEVLIENQQPTKRKVNSERYFAVTKNANSSDGLQWEGPYELEASARGYHPNALAYHCATVEVEVSE